MVFCLTERDYRQFNRLKVSYQKFPEKQFFKMLSSKLLFYKFKINFNTQQDVAKIYRAFIALFSFD